MRTLPPTILIASSILALLAGPALAQDLPKTPPTIPAGYYVSQKVVYQNSGGWPDEKAYAQRLLRNVAAHIEATGGDVEIRVVTFSAGIKLFQLAKTDPALAESLDSLRAKGVRFLICRNTLTGMKITAADLYKVGEADIVPSGAAEIARLQGQGFVYVRP